MATTFNPGPSRAAGTGEQQSSAIPLQSPSSQSSSRPRTISGVAVPFFAYVKEKWEKKKKFHRFTDIWSCTREVSFDSVLAGTSGFNGTDPQSLSISYQHNSL